MSIYTTLDVTRAKAAEIYLKEFGIDDKQLEKFMDRYLQDRCYNCIIVDNDHIPNDDAVV